MKKLFQQSLNKFCKRILSNVISMGFLFFTSSMLVSSLGGRFSSFSLSPAVMFTTFQQKTNGHAVIL